MLSLACAPDNSRLAVGLAGSRWCWRYRCRVHSPVPQTGCCQYGGVTWAWRRLPQRYEFARACRCNTESVQAAQAAVLRSGSYRRGLAPRGAGRAVLTACYAHCLICARGGCAVCRFFIRGQSATAAEADLVVRSCVACKVRLIVVSCRLTLDTSRDCRSVVFVLGAVGRDCVCCWCCSHDTIAVR